MSRAAGTSVVGRFELEPRAACLAGCRHQLRDWLAARGCPLAVIDDLCLAGNEAMANAIEHSDSGAIIDVLVVFSAACVELDVSNVGVWVDRAVPRPYRGRGLELMRALTDRVEIRTDGERVTVSLAVDLQKPRAEQRTFGD